MKKKKLAVRKFITAVKEQPVKFRKIYYQLDVAGMQKEGKEKNTKDNGRAECLRTLGKY